jgi:hypothetical protein
MGREINIDSIQVLEEQIEDHERAIVKLKRARNSLLNVSTLPPEVLGNIFRWNVTLKDAFGGLEEKSHNFLLVCHHWFEVASRTPELWTFWGTSLEEWEECHLRSRVGAPLDLVLNGSIHRDGFVSESQHRVLEDRAIRDTIRRVHLHSDMHSDLTSIISPLISPRGGLRTNALESLILVNEDEDPLDVSFFTHSRLSKLRHLKLTGCAISSWDNLVSQSTLLTTLELFFDDASPTPTMPQLLSILTSNPHLQTLTLNAHAIPHDVGDGHSQQVPLCHLEKLRLDGDVGRVFGLLRRLEYPKEMGKLSLSPSCTVADISQTIGPYVRDYLRCRGRSRDGLGLSLSSLGSLIVFHVGNVGGLRSTSERERMVSFMEFTIGLDPVPGDVQEKVTLDLIAHIPREDVIYFRACGSLTVVEDLRAQLPNLKVLDLHMVRLYAAFSTPISEDGSHVQERFPPSLQHIYLGRLIVNGYDWIPLVAFLARRASVGNQLDSLIIDGPCHMCSTTAEGIRRIVRTQFWVNKGCLESWCPFGSCLY